MRKKYTIGIISILILGVLTFFLLHSFTYSMLDINADNYRKKLKENTTSIYESYIDNCIPDKISILQSRDYSESNNFEGNGLKIHREENNANGRLAVEIVSSTTGLRYQIYFDKDKGAIAGQISHHPIQYDILLKNICDQMILKEGFILKKSELITGNDILIKETDTSFIIIDVSPKYEYPDFPMSLMISTYSKKRFF